MNLLSMTSFATLDASLQGKNYRFSLKAVNNRSIEIKIRSPKNWNPIEIEIRNFLAEKIFRGSVEFSVEEVSDLPSGMQKENLVSSYFAKLAQALKASQGTGPWFFCSPFRVYALIHNPTWWLTHEDKVYLTNSIDFNPELVSVLEQLSVVFVDCRKREGAKLETALWAYVKNIDSLFKQLKDKLPDLKENWEAQIRERIQKILKDNQVPLVSEERIHQEILILGEKRSVEEEIVRIETHLTELKRVLQSEEKSPRGKRLEFLLQELHREWTTFGNKIQNSGISHQIIEAKLELDKLKEQSLNIL